MLMCPFNVTTGLSLFGYISGATRICVNSCNASVTNLYGDVQANRTCVATCAASPLATFGDKTSSRCVTICPTVA